MHRRSLLVVLLLSVAFVRPTWADDEKPGSLAVFAIGGVSESSSAGGFPFGGGGGESLRGLIGRIHKAAADKEIKGVVILTGSPSIGIGQLEELRQALNKVTAAGKKIHVHSTSLDIDGYTLGATGRICVTPTGDVSIAGIYGERLYLRGLLDLIGVHPQFLACGDYKSASETYMRHGPSDAAKENQDWLYDGIFETYIRLIAEGRKAKADDVRKWIDEGHYSAESAKKAGIIDDVLDRREFVKSLQKTYGEKVVFDKSYGKKKANDIDLSTPFGLMKFYTDLLSGGAKTKASTKPAIAIIHVDGGIQLGDAAANPFSLTPGSGAFSTPLSKSLYKAADAETVKGVLLRVDSPGGSALASEIILRACREVASKKPLIVSMGNVAGSGGYYVAMASNTIYADESTITGSIGVVGGKLATADMLRRVGVHLEPVRRGKNAGLMASGAAMSREDAAKMQAMMDDVYETFKGHVIENRGKKLKKPIDELAGGRVFTGKQALDLGLVDKIGTLQDALAQVATEAKVGDDYRVVVLPKSKSFLDILLGDSSDDDKNPHDIDISPTDFSRGGRVDLMKAALPYLEHLDPRRSAAVGRAIMQLMVLQKEGVSLTMPELIH